MAEARHIATFAPVQIGDTVMAIPLYQALRKKFPQARLTLLSQQINHPVLEGINVFDEIIPYTGNEDWASLPYDLQVLPFFCGSQKIEDHFNLSLRAVTRQSLMKRQQETWKNRWTGLFDHLLFYRHQVELNMELAKSLGYEGPIPALYCPQGKEENWRHWRNFIGFFITTPANAFQALPSRLWPLEHWRKLIHLLEGDKVVLIGSIADQPNLELLARQCDRPYIVVSSIAEFTGLCRNLRFLVTTDGGSMHLAATTDVPIISLFGTASPLLLHPWIYPNGKCIAVLSPNLCSPCQRSYRWRLCELEIKPMTCMQNLLPREILLAVKRLPSLKAGNCFILKNGCFQTKKQFQKSLKRQVTWFLIHNASRLRLKTSKWH